MSTSRRVHAGFASSMKWLAGRSGVRRRIAESHHRRPGDPGLEGADVCLGVALPGELLLREPCAMSSLADPLPDAVRQLTVLLGGSGAGSGPWHDGSLHGAGKHHLTWRTPKVPPSCERGRTDGSLSGGPIGATVLRSAAVQWTTGPPHEEQDRCVPANRPHPDDRRLRGGAEHPQHRLDRDGGVGRRRLSPTSLVGGSDPGPPSRAHPAFGP